LQHTPFTEPLIAQRRRRPGGEAEAGAREEGIQILRWGSPDESLRLLQAHQGYRHIRRMVLELQGEEAAAASLE